MKFRKTLEGLCHSGHYSHMDVLRNFVTLAACCLAMPVGSGKTEREDEYMSIVGRLRDKEDAKVYAAAFSELIDEMSMTPYVDLLGELSMDWQGESTRSSLGEFFTPIDVCRAMARMTIQDPHEFCRERAMRIMEPACGSGRLILAVAEYMKEVGLPTCHMKATCVDVNKLSADMCFVNLTLWGIPAEVIHGNSLSLEVFAAHRNIFWYSAHGTGGVSERPSPPIEIAAEVALQKVASVSRDGQILMEF